MALLATAGLASTALASNDTPHAGVSRGLPDHAQPTPAHSSPVAEAVVRVGSENRAHAHPDLAAWFTVFAGLALALAFGALRRRHTIEVPHRARRQYRPRAPPALLPV